MDKMANTMEIHFVIMLHSLLSTSRDWVSISQQVTVKIVHSWLPSEVFLLFDHDYDRNNMIMLFILNLLVIRLITYGGPHNHVISGFYFIV